MKTATIMAIARGVKRAASKPAPKPAVCVVCKAAPANGRLSWDDVCDACAAPIEPWTPPVPAGRRRCEGCGVPAYYQGDLEAVTCGEVERLLCRDCAAEELRDE